MNEVRELNFRECTDDEITVIEKCIVKRDIICCSIALLFVLIITKCIKYFDFHVETISFNAARVVLVILGVVFELPRCIEDNSIRDCLLNRQVCIIKLLVKSKTNDIMIVCPKYDKDLSIELNVKKLGCFVKKNKNIKSLHAVKYNDSLKYFSLKGLEND